MTNHNSIIVTEQPAASAATVPSWSARSVFWPGLALLLLAGVLLRIWLLDNFPLTPDEGIHLAWLRLLSAGYRPYSEVYITYPPLYPLAIDLVWRLAPGEAAQRWFSVAYTLFGVVGLALLARKFAGPAAGLAAAFLAVFSPPLVEPSRAILGEFPSIAWSIWAVWLAWLYRDGGPRRRFWLALSGLCLAASLLTKLLSPFIVVLAGLMILESHWRMWRIGKDQPGDHRPAFLPALRPLLMDLVIWGLALLLPALLLLAVFDGEALVRQVVDQRLEARAAYVEDESFWPPRLERGSMFFREDPALVILGLAGLLLAAQKRRRETWLLLAWLLLALAMLAVHNPIRYKHFLILIPPLAVLGGALIGFTIYDFGFWILDLQWKGKAGSFIRHPSRPFAIRSRFAAIRLAGLLLLAALAAWQVPAALALWQAKADVPQPPPDEVEALAFIESITAPGDCLITDDMQLLYWSGRLAPPELAEVSQNRLKSGALTTPELIEISDRYDCQLVAAVSNRIAKYLPDYMDWVKSRYLGRFHYGEDDLFFAKRDTDPRPETPLWADFAGQLLFHGYNLPPAAPGSRLPLTLVWQAQDQPPADYAVFVQLRAAADGTILAGADHQPYGGLLPTSAWPAGAVVREVTWLVLPPDLASGRYNLYVGLYRPDTLERLPLAGDTSGENALILGPVVIP